MDAALAVQQAGFDIQQLVSGAVGAAVVTGLFLVIQTVVTKRLRTPADNLAGQDFAYKVIKERLEEANADRKVLTDTVNYLREDARKRDATDAEDFDREQQKAQLIRDLNSRIDDLESKIHRYEDRLTRLAEKVRLGIPITVHDIYETSPAGSPLGDLEDTQRKE